MKPGSFLRGKYLVTEQLGSGTRGFIFAAELHGDKKGGFAKAPQRIILKVSDSEWEFRNELWLTRKKFQEIVGSPHVHEVFPLTKQPWCVCAMERFGPNLVTAWKGYSKDESKCMRGMRGLLERLQAAHEIHLAHLDVKPLNICETLDMQDWRLVDWGHAENMALLGHHHRGQTGAVCYQSPEMLAGQEWDFSTDIWSAGVVLLEVFLGQVWDEEHWQLFDWPDQCGQDVLEQMESTLGRLPDWMRSGISEQHESLHGKADDLFKRCPPVLADLLRHLLRYDPAQRASARDALKHVWLAVPERTTANLQAWLEKMYEKWHQTWVLHDVEHTSVDEALQELCRNGDHEVADGFVQAFMESELKLSVETFGTLIETQLRDGVVKRAKRWLDFTCSRHMDLGEDAVARIVQAAGDQYENVVKTIEEYGLPLSPKVFTLMAKRAEDPYRLTEIEKMLMWMVRANVAPESEFVRLLFSTYSQEILTGSFSRKKHSVAHYAKGEQAKQPRSDAAQKALAKRAEISARKILQIEPLPLLDRLAMQTMYRAVGGDRGEEILSRDKFVAERLAEAKSRIDEDEAQKLHIQQAKAQEIQTRKDEIARQKEEQQSLAAAKASQVKATLIAPRNRKFLQKRAMSATLPNRRSGTPSKVSAWR